jgi:hypothetical protein
LVEAATGVTFHVEHVIPRSLGGKTALANLALSCPGCNLAKAERTVGKDSSGCTFPLFNPRDFEPWLLGWHIHFELDRKSGIIVARTSTGEATVLTLRMNAPQLVFARRLQIRAGVLG